MRFVTYVSPTGGDRVGVVDGDQVHGCDPHLTLLQILESGDLHEAGERALETPSETVKLSGLPLRAPLQPRSIRDCVGHVQHVRNAPQALGQDVPDLFLKFPAYYFSNPSAVVGPYDDVAIPPDCEQFDYELEVAAVLGRRGSNIALDQAEEYIAGYLIMCDWSARDLHLAEAVLGLGPIKGKDSANTLGPMLVTPDELEPYRSTTGFDLELTAYLNGDRVSTGRWNTIDWGFADMITFASRGAVVSPGDVICSGTVPMGCLFEHFATAPDEFRGFLKPGDEVRLVVEQLGELRQRVVAGPPAQRLSSGY